MSRIEIGPTSRRQLAAIDKAWKQGQHVMISGATGSGKTRLARELIRIRRKHNGYSAVLVAKLEQDKTITQDYAGFTRWKKWKRNPAPYEHSVLVWPDTKGMNLREASKEIRDVFEEALNGFARAGKWTFVIDEGLFTTAPSGLNLGYEIGMLSQLIRSADGTLILLAQRPSNLPLSVYSNISHAFIGTTNNIEDRKRIAEFAKYDSRELEAQIKANGEHDFLWIPVATGGTPERIDLKK